MSNYTQATDFSAKDALPTGNVSKKILGSEVDAELALIATAISSKVNTTDLDATLADLISSDSFTGTLTGFGSNPSGTVSYYKVGAIVTLSISSNLQGTSNSQSMTMTGLPAEIHPNNAKVASNIVVDTGQTQPGLASVSAAGVITFQVYNDGAGQIGGFINSGTKGLPAGWTITYSTD